MKENQSMKKYLRKVLLFFILVFVLALTSVIPAAAASKKPVLNKKTAAIYVGQTTQLKVTGSTVKVKWSSSKSSVASVSSTGKVTAKKAGNAVIKAKVGKVTLSCKVTVKKPEMSKSTATIYVGGTSLSLKVNGLSKNTKVTWSTTKKSVAKVSSAGKVTAVKAGSAVIQAKAGKTTYSCKVTVRNPYLNKKSAVMIVKDSLQLKLNGISKVTWSSSKPSVAKVSSKGKVTAVKTGTATITAKFGKKKYTCKITVKQGSISKSSASLYVGGKTLTLTLKNVTLKSASSSNPAIAKVTSKGVVTAVKAGICTITLKDTGSRTYTCKITVLNPSINVKAKTLYIGESQQLNVNDGTIRASWASDKPEVASVSPEGLVTAVSEGTAVITGTVAKLKLRCRIDVKKPLVVDGDDDFYTRGEYVELLLQKLNHDVSLDEIDDNHRHYADSKDSVHGTAAEAAYALDLLPDVADEQDVPVFEEEKALDRELLAYTVVKAMGFEVGEEQALSCSDAEQVTYKDIAAIAVSEGIISLKDGMFAPADAASRSEVNQAFRVIDSQNDAVVIDENYDSKVEYVPGVVETPVKEDDGYQVTQNADGTYTIVIQKNAKGVNVSVGNIFILPANKQFDTDLAFRATAVVKDAAGNCVITAVQPEEISEVFESIDFEGACAADADQVEPASGVSYTYEPLDTLDGTIGGSVALPAKLKFDIGDGVDLGHGAELGAEVEITIPDITCKLDANFGLSGIKVNDFIMSVTATAEIKGGVGIEKSETITHASGTIEKVSNVKELGRVPIHIGTTGMTGEIVFSMFYEASGEIKIVYTANTTVGYRYSNGAGRFIKDFSQSIDPVSISGNGKIGAQIGFNICALHFDLVGVDFQVGPQVKASGTWHAAEGILCVDANISLYKSFGLNTDTMVGKFLESVCHLTIRWDLTDKGPGSNLKWNPHFENFQYKQECTIGSGDITGGILDASNRTPIANARVVVSDAEGVEAGVAYTDSQGIYRIDGLHKGNYVIKVSATDYKTYTSSEITVVADRVTYIENYLMVKRDQEEPGYLSGDIINSITGESLSGVQYTVRKGWNNVTGEVVESGTASYDYEIELLPGNYTLVATADDFIESAMNVAIVSGEYTSQRISLTPENVEMDGAYLTIVLTWGETPYDLDSHLIGPRSDNGTDIFHVYYSDKSAWENYEDMLANLDLDDTSSYGPETTTIVKLHTGLQYSYYVHDYTNRYDNQSTKLSASGAKVRVYESNRLIEEFNVPVGVGGTLWHVFDYDAATNRITPVNTMSYQEYPGDVGSRANTLLAVPGMTPVLSEEAAINIITDSCKEKESLKNTQENVMEEDAGEENVMEEEILEETPESEPDTQEVDVIIQDAA